MENEEKGSQTLPAVTEEGGLPHTKQTYLQKYSEDIVESFEAFLSYSQNFPIDLLAVDESSTKEEVLKSDAKMLHALQGALSVGLNRVRSVSDVAAMNNAVTKYLRERRVLLGHVDKEDAEGFWKPL